MSKKNEKSCGCGCGCGNKLQPLDDRIVVKRLDAEEKTAGGIILPDAAKEKPQRGEIIAVGPGKLLDSGTRATPDVAVGDTVIFGKYSGTEVKVDGVELLIMRENDILAKL
ncbi:MAG: co-chaperone GroES [Planctomycetaceae bacterium]|nr:co-chaperone GroES [Planctomycetaceae bacterium]